MCGIAGYIGKDEIGAGTCQSVLSLMRQRGPDSQKYRIFEDRGTTVALLHSRLSIIDLDVRADQPFQKDDCTLVFNGEIYNYKELRRQLDAKGVEMLTDSDTEVLITYYLLYGEQCVTHFEGMWAFAIYDRRRGTVLLSRDRFAEKPLYLFEAGDGVYFASETRFLKALAGTSLEVNTTHLLRYLVNGYKSLYKTSETYYKDVKELPPAANMVIGPGARRSTYAYWRPEFRDQEMTLDEAIEGTRARLQESMRLRLRSDVPVAFCLSGGIDSAGLVSLAAKEFGQDAATFSIIDPDERYNEAENIGATVEDLGCRHTSIQLNPTENFFDRLQSLIAYHDAPVATISYLVHSMLSEKINESGYKVAFSGTAADELFTGYYDHFNLHLYEMRNSPDFERYLSDWEQNTGRYVRNPLLKNPRLYFDNPGIRDHIYLNRDQFKGFLKNDFTEDFSEVKYHPSLLKNRMMNELFHEGSRVILHEDDLNSMRYSVENRSPYLDSKLVEFAYSIPCEHLIQNGYGKYVLREAYKDVLNDQVRLDRVKKGFNASISSLLDMTNGRHRATLLDDGPIFDLVKKECIEDLMSMDHLPNSYSKFLFNFLNCKLFLENQTPAVEG